MRARTLWLAVTVAALALPAAGCGGGDRSAPRPPVRLTLDAPTDRESVDADVIAVRGRVWPAGARVLVDGREAHSDGRSFTAEVPLEPGMNIIDVVAGARERPSAMTAVRVTRVVLVEVPELSGQAPSEAARALRELGLVPELRKRGGLLDEILPGTYGVCSTDPDAGTRIAPGERVAVDYAKSC